MINTAKNTAAGEAAIIITGGNELLFSFVIAMVGMNTVVEDPGVKAFVFSISNDVHRHV